MSGALMTKPNIVAEQGTDLARCADLLATWFGDEYPDERKICSDIAEHIRELESKLAQAEMAARMNAETIMEMQQWTKTSGDR